MYSHRLGLLGQLRTASPSVLRYDSSLELQGIISKNNQRTEYKMLVSNEEEHRLISGARASESLFQHKRVCGVLGKLISFSKPQFLHLCPQYLAHHLVMRVQYDSTKIPQGRPLLHRAC